MTKDKIDDLCDELEISIMYLRLAKNGKYSIYGHRKNGISIGAIESNSDFYKEDFKKGFVEWEDEE